MTLAVVQHASNHGSGSSTIGSVTLGAAPTLGNLLIAFVAVNVSPTVPTLANGWQLFCRAETDTGTNTCLLGLYRYVQSGDTTALPAFASSGSSFWGATVQEISGVSGVWENDFLSAQSSLPAASTSIPVPPTRATTANCLALVGFAQYDGNHAPSLSAGWTADELQLDFSDYGIYGCGHQSTTTADTVVAGTITFGTSSAPNGAITLILTPTTPSHATIRQTKTVSGNGTPGAVTLFNPPKNGSLLVAVLHWGNGGTLAPVIGSSWSQFATALNGSNTELIALERYAGSGESATLPAIATSGSTFFALTIIELHGVLGTWASDFHSVVTGRQASGATQVTNVSSASGDTLALMFAANYDANAAMSISSGWENFQSNVNFSNYGAWIAAEQHFPTGGSINATITEGISSQPAAYAQILLGGSAAPSALVASQLGFEVWMEAAQAVEVTQVGFEVWARVQAEAKVSQAVVEVWSSNPSKVKVSQALIELWRSVSGTNTHYIAGQIGFEVWEGFTYVTPPSFKKTVIIVMG